MLQTDKDSQLDRCNIEFKTLKNLEKGELDVICLSFCEFISIYKTIILIVFLSIDDKNSLLHMFCCNSLRLLANKKMFESLACPMSVCLNSASSSSLSKRAQLP